LRYLQVPGRPGALVRQLAEISEVNLICRVGTAHQRRPVTGGRCPPYKSAKAPKSTGSCRDTERSCSNAMARKLTRKRPERYVFLLNPYTDGRLSKCPKCSRPTHPR